MFGCEIGRDGLCLPVEPPQRIGIASDLRRQNLDRDRPIEARVGAR